MTDAQLRTMQAVRAADLRGWFRARNPGERVVLANLYRMRAIERRVWREAKHAADNAHEYRLARRDSDWTREAPRMPRWPGSIG